MKPSPQWCQVLHSVTMHMPYPNLRQFSIWILRFSFKFGVWFYMLSNLSLTVTAAYIGAREALLGRNGVYEGRDELRGVGETLPKRGA